MRYRNPIANAALMIGMLLSPGCAGAQNDPPHPSMNGSNESTEPQETRAVDPVRGQNERQAPFAAEEGGLVPSGPNVAPKELTLRAIESARSDDPTRHQRLRAQLTSESDLYKLNSADEYLRLPPESLQLNFILQALTQSTNELAIQTLDHLAADRFYQRPGAHQILLLKASGRIHVAPANLRALWKSQLDPGADELGLTVEALVSNGSAPARTLLEEALLTQDYPPDYVMAWLREVFLTHRQDPPLLASAERLLRSDKWPAPYKEALLEVLYDYRPQAWYHQENDPPKPPDRADLSPVARQKLRSIADWALRQGLLQADRHATIQAGLQAR